MSYQSLTSSLSGRLLLGLWCLFYGSCSSSTCSDHRFRDDDPACQPVVGVAPEQTALYSDLESLANLGGRQFRTRRSVSIAVNPQQSLVAVACTVAQVDNQGGNDLIAATTTVSITDGKTFNRQLLAFLNVQ